MELKVFSKGEEIGACRVRDEGLYWSIQCQCRRDSSGPVRLYGAGHNLGVPEPAGEQWLLRRRLSKASVPGFPAEEGCMLLSAEQSSVTVCGYRLVGEVVEGENGIKVYIPFSPDAPHPCMPLMCFWRLRGSFWEFELDKSGNPVP